VSHAARKDARSLKQAFKDRKAVILDARITAQKLKFAKAEEQRLRKLQELETQANDVVYFGLWQSKEQILLKLKSIPSKTEKIEALKAQLRFRKNLLQQTPPDKLIYMFSTKSDTGKRRDLSVDELCSNLELLVQHAFSRPIHQDEGTHLLVGKRIRQRFIEDGMTKWYPGQVISQVPKHCCILIVSVLLLMAQEFRGRYILFSYSSLQCSDADFFLFSYSSLKCLMNIPS
jgi:hypothetical protein